MSSKVTFELEGFDELLRATEELGRKGAGIENEALRRGAEFLIKEIKAEAPVRTGQLRDDIGTVGGIRNVKGIKSIHIGSDNSRSNRVLHFLETGTSKMAANPFMTRTFELNKLTALNILKQQLKIGLGV